MAIFHLDVKVIGRSTGRSVVAAAAYRAGERIRDERTGLLHNYSHRQEIEAYIFAPEGAPVWFTDRDTLWNHVELIERRKDSQLAREVMVALPVELSPEQHRDLLAGYVKDQFTSRGMVADVAIHRDDPGNPHAHILLSTRDFGPDGFTKKNRSWNRRELVLEWRERWANYTNYALEKAGVDKQIDHRSLAEQGIDRPARVHLGPHASAMEAKGMRTALGDHNRAVDEYEGIVIDLEMARAERDRLMAEREAEAGKAQEARGKAQAQREQAMRELQARRAEVARQIADAESTLAEIRREEQRLSDARYALGRRDEERERLAEHEGFLPRLRRVFSTRARTLYEQAETRLRHAEDRLTELGVTSREDLGRQVAEFRHLQHLAVELDGELADLRRERSRIWDRLLQMERESERDRGPVRDIELER